MVVTGEEMEVRWRLLDRYRLSEDIFLSRHIMGSECVYSLEILF